MSKMITVAVQSPEGQKRVQVSSTGKADDLYKNVLTTFDLKSMQFGLYKDQKKTKLIDNSSRKSITSTGLRHGDRLFMFPRATTGELFKSAESSSPSVENGAIVIEDQVDTLLHKEAGTIERNRDNLSCQCNVNSQCVYCIPLDPFDESYLKEKQIKFLSFHSYLRKLSSGASKGKFTPLKSINCKVLHTPRCSHQPYPQGICSKCQPSAVTLNRQSWRHVDSIIFENPQIVDRFLQFWRESGAQRGGWLYGRYDVYSDVPLGIKAVVSAIYEPPQESSKDHINILPDPKQEVLDELTKSLGLVKVGWIFTDLISSANGKVKNFRGLETHFLSAQEIITAAHFQNTHPNPCKSAEGGHFGSKFVTVCVTGNKENEVHMEGYQVSNQSMALVRDNILLPTKDAPELAFVRESTDENYVPDVFFMQKDEYGNEIKKLGRPLPVEYLLIDVPVSTPKEPLSTFSILKEKKAFPVENRLLESSLQDFNSFAQYISQFRSAEFFDSVADLHVLVFLATLDIVPLRVHMGPLLKSIKEGDRQEAREWSYEDPWVNLKALVEAATMG